MVSGTLSSTLYHREGSQPLSPPSISSSPQPPLMNGDVSCVAFGPAFGGSSLLASAGDDGFIRLWNLNYCPKASIGEIPWAVCFLTLPLSSPSHFSSPTPNSPEAGSNGLFYPALPSSSSEISHVAFSPCGKFVAGSSSNGSIQEFDIEDHLRSYRLSAIATCHVNGSLGHVESDGGPAASISPWYELPHHLSCHLSCHPHHLSCHVVGTSPPPQIIRTGRPSPQGQATMEASPHLRGSAWEEPSPSPTEARVLQWIDLRWKRCRGLINTPRL